MSCKTPVYYGIGAATFHFEQTRRLEIKSVPVMMTWVGQTNKLEKNIHDSFRCQTISSLFACAQPPSHSPFLHLVRNRAYLHTHTHTDRGAIMDCGGRPGDQNTLQ